MVIWLFSEEWCPKDLRRFLGMTGCYRAFCPNFASVVSPLTDLLSPKSDFVWTNICQQAFDNAKALLVNAPCGITNCI